MHHRQVLPQLCKNELGRKRVKLHKINYTWFFEMSVNRPIASIHDKPLGFTGLTVFFFKFLIGVLTREIAELEDVDYEATLRMLLLSHTVLFMSTISEACT